MELRQLRYFVTVAKTLSFSEAARELFITQGTLSQQIQQLEAEAGVELFRRNSRNVALTEEGRDFLPAAMRAVEASRQCSEKIKDLRSELGGTLNIGVTYSFRSMLTETVKQFVREHPAVKLTIYYKTASELHEMLRTGEVDFILAFKPLLYHPEIVSEELFTCDLSAIMRRDHPLADRKSLTIKDLERQRIILPGSGLQARRTFERFIDVDTSSLDVCMEVNDPDMLLDILQGTRMVAVMSALGLKERPMLVSIPIDGFDTSMPGCVHYLKDGYRKRSMTAFLDML